MNDDLQKALAEILNKTTQGVEAGVGFLQRELPEVVQQLLLWHGIKSGIFFSVFVSLCALSLYAFVKGWNWSVKTEWDAGPLGLFPSLPAIGFLIAALHNFDWLQILIAPKLYLIEYTASLVK